MKTFRGAVAPSGLLVAVVVSSAAMAAAPVTQQAQTAHYRIELDVGPMEEMFMQADVAAKHLTDGELMVSGNMATPKDMATARHVEVHAYSLDQNATVTSATVSIAVTDAAKNVQQLPIAKMYGIAEGPSDTHFGNNLSLPAGNYTIDAIVNGERATFRNYDPAGLAAS
jgi:hypothetical protein